MRTWIDPTGARFEIEEEYLVPETVELLLILGWQPERLTPPITLRMDEPHEVYGFTD